MTNTPRIYLDNAATSWPKPETVYQAVDRYQRELGAAAGRGSYREAIESGQIVRQCRQAIATLIGAASPERIVFTSNGTDSLNLAIHGMLRPGDRVITSDAEHNSVLRPLRLLEKQGVIVERIACDATGLVDLHALEQALKQPVRLVAIVHASNVVGTIQPIEAIVPLAHTAGALVLIDAAQTLGHLPIDVSKTSIDLLAAPGHKGLLGPLGTGVLYVAPGVETELQSVRQGGTGTQSESDEQPESLPDKYESGNLNVCGIAGLLAGVTYVRETGTQQLRDHAEQLTEQLLAGLSEISGIQSYGPSEAKKRVGVVSLTSQIYDPQELAALVEGTFGIQARSGLHCAPRMHQALGTLASGGTLRLSVGPFSTSEDINQALAALRIATEL